MNVPLALDDQKRQVKEYNNHLFSLSFSLMNPLEKLKNSETSTDQTTFPKRSNGVQTKLKGFF